jgi:hypothetical protein
MHFLVCLSLYFAIASASKIVSFEDYTNLADSTLKELRACRNKATLASPQKMKKFNDPISSSENIQGWFETSFYDKQDSCNSAYEKDYLVLNHCGSTSGIPTYGNNHVMFTATTTDASDSYVVTTNIYDEYGCDNFTSSVTQNFTTGKCTASSSVGSAVTQTITTSPVDSFGIVVAAVYSSQEACYNYSASGLLEVAYGDSDFCYTSSSYTSGDYRYVGCDNGTIITAFYDTRDGTCGDFLYNATVPNDYNCEFSRSLFNFFGSFAFKCGILEPPFPPPPVGTL